MAPNLQRRDFVKAAGAAGATAAVGATGASGRPASDTTISDGLRTDTDEPQEAIVVFDENESIALLDSFDLVDGYFGYQVLPMAYTKLTGEQVSALAEREAVRYVSETFELEYYNDQQSRQAMHVEAVNAGAFDGVSDTLGFDGSGVDAVVIDSGIDGAHPDFQGRVESNYEFVDSPLGDREPMWVDIGAGDSDDVGHGQHCCGIVAGDGFASTTEGTGPYVGMAPGARLSSYSTSQTVYLPYAVGAWDHMIARKRDPSDEFDPVVCSNSYGVARGNRFNPLDPLNVATWEAFEEGILPVFALGNDGPDKGTISRYAKAPHVLGVAAGTKEKTITGFSSRGRDVGDELPDGTTFGAGDGYHDRATLLSNLAKYHDLLDDGQFLVDQGTLSGELGPGVQGAVGVVDENTAANTHVLDLPSNADRLEGDLSVTPDGQVVKVSFYTDYGTDDEELLARMGEEPVYIHKDIALDVPGGETVTVEFEPQEAVAVQYEFDYALYDHFGFGGGYDGAALDDLRPLTLYRPGVATHGNSVMSTFDPEDALAPLSTGDGEPFYGRISGTSMACPAAAGIAVLLIDAGTSDDGAGLDYVGAGSDRADEAGTFTPLDVLYTIEATATDVHPEYTPASAGPGWIHAADAVERSAAGDFAGPSEVSLVDPSTPVPPTNLSVTGSRGDDGSLFTAGSTDQIDVTLASVDGATSASVTVYDFVPTSWRVAGGDATVVFEPESDDPSQASVPTRDGAKTVELGSGAATYRYFVEAPSASGQYTFGPATAVTSESLSGSESVEFGGTDSNTVVGVSQQRL